MLTETQKQCKHEWIVKKYSDTLTEFIYCSHCKIKMCDIELYHQGLNDRALEAVKLLTDESMHTIGSVRHKMVWHCIDLLKSKFGVE